MGSREPGEGRGPWPGCYLILLGALGQLPELGVKLREAPRDLLDACVQVAVLAVLRVEVVLVALALLRGGNGGVFSEETEKRGRQGSGGCGGRGWSAPGYAASPTGRQHRATSRLCGPGRPPPPGGGASCSAGQRAGWGEGAKPAREVLTASSPASLRSMWGHLSCCRSRSNLQRKIKKSVV